MDAEFSPLQTDFGDFDPEEKHTILKMAEAFIKELSPLKVILFGSFASGQYSESSDYDFYILEENTWIIQDANGKIRVWDKDFLDCGETFFGYMDSENLVCEKIGENTYKEVAV